LSAILSLLTTILAAAFAAMMLDQYLERRRPHHRVWAAALVIFSAATAFQFLGATYGWTSLIYRLWFLFGAALSAAVLGLGSAYLVLPKRVADVLAGLLVIGGFWSAYQVMGLSLPSNLGRTAGAPPALLAMPAELIVVVATMNAGGTLIIVAAALWSAWRYLRVRGFGYMILANLLILVGALIFAGSGSLARLGRPEYLFAGELLGISLIFAGFLRAQREFHRGSLPLLRHMNFGRPARPQSA
jgi:hypothetical protein